jgi:hypothetical protein
MNDLALPFDHKGIITEAAQAMSSGSGTFTVTFDRKSPKTGVTITALGDGWDLTAYSAVALDVANPGKTECAIYCHLGKHRWTDGVAIVPPGGRETIWVLLKQEDLREKLKDRFPAMNGFPGDQVWIWDAPDPGKVPGLTIYPAAEAFPESIEISNIRATRINSDEEPSPASDGIFPFVDGYGQYIHRDWDDKVNCDNCLAGRKKREEIDLPAHTGPAEWNRYGGWAKGPKLKSAGHFRTEKVEGKWWLVDPEGRLFWSHGITCVNITERTRFKGRERFFSEIPQAGDPLAEFLHADTFDFYGANLSRKYGVHWRDEAYLRAHRRLRSWGMNTIGNWSDPAICALHKTPYCIPIHYGGPKLDTGFPVVRDPGFRAALATALADAAKETARDPWCIGYFIDNELNWPTKDRAETAEIYYRICLEEMRKAAPDKLFLGSRIHMHYYPGEGEEDVVLAAAKYCDVVSFNRYRFSAADLKLLSDVDKSVIVGEWHFGALDRGMLHTGLRSVGTQAQRGRTYEFYAKGAIRNPALVGCHWFQYHDQCVTGRGDGENYQIGFLDICDTPYTETVEGCRNAGYSIYRDRTSGG